MNNKPYTYYIVCPNWKLYYGYRSANKVSPEEDLWKHYFSSSDPVKELRKQYDDALFVATVHKTFETGDEAREYEEKFLTENGCVKSDFWLNRAVYPKQFCTPEHLPEETKKKLSIAHMGKTLSKEHREKIGNAHRGMKRSEETKRKISKAKKEKGKTGSKCPIYGIPLSKEHKEKIANAHRGMKRSEKARENMRIAQKGLNVGSKNGFYGKTHTEEIRKKLSIARKGTPMPEESIKKREETKRKKRLEDPNYGKPKPAPKKNRI